MNSREENKYTMYKGICNLLNKKTEIISGIPAFVECVNKFSETLESISKKDEEYLTKSKGSAETKHNAEKELIDILMVFSSAMYVLGRVEKDENLQSLCRLTRSDIERKRDTALLQEAKMILDKAAENQKYLVNLGLSSKDLTDFNNKVRAYDKALTNKESKGAEGKAARKELKEEFSTADEILKEEIDNFMAIIKSKDIEFYNAYQALRVIKDL